MGIRENVIAAVRTLASAEKSKAEFARRIGATRQQVGNWMAGDNAPDIEVCAAIASAYDLPLTAVLYNDLENRIENEGFTDVPLYGRIAAGTPIEMDAVEDYYPVPTPVVERYKNPDAPDGLGLFLLRIEGESMNLMLPNGCLALVEPCREVTRDNKPYAVCVNGYDATIKKVRRLNNGFELIPCSTDPTYEAVVYNYNEPGTEEITIIGRVVYHMLPFDWEY